MQWHQVTVVFSWVSRIQPQMAERGAEVGGFFLSSAFLRRPLRLVILFFQAKYAVKRQTLKEGL